MKGVLALGGASLGFLAVPFIALLALTGVASTAVACSGVAGGELAADAPVPVDARGWVAIAPGLPRPAIQLHRRDDVPGVRLPARRVRR